MILQPSLAWSAAGYPARRHGGVRAELIRGRTGDDVSRIVRPVSPLLSVTFGDDRTRILAFNA
jgi:hypothetical protein